MVDFYQRYLNLPVIFATDWFVEFALGRAARLSLADETRATIESGRGAGITLALEVENADAAWQYLHGMGLELEPVRDHAWGARVFYFTDPEGHRLEIWAAYS